MFDPIAAPRVLGRAALLSFGLLVAACGPDSAPPPPAAAPEQQLSESERLNAFFAEVFARDLRRSPMFQTYIGVKDDYDKLDDVSEARQDQDIALVRQDLFRLKSEFDVNKLDDASRLSYRLFEYLATQKLEGDRWRHHNYPFNQLFGWQSHIPSFMGSAHQVNSVADAEAYVARLNAVPQVMKDLLDGLRRRADKGVLPPQFVFPQVIAQAQTVIAGAPFAGDGDSPLYADFKTKVAALDAPQADKDRLLAAAEGALRQAIKPAYDDLIAAMRALAPKATADDGVWKLPNGAAYYTYKLREETTTDLSAEEIHSLGLREVARIHKEMEAIKAKVGFEGDLRAFFQVTRTDPKFYYPDSDEGRARYMQDVSAVIDDMRGRLDGLFNIKPKAGLEVRRVEPFREKNAPTAFYQQPALDGSRPGYYYVNLYDMKALPLYQLAAIAYHEAIPGHHMQIAIAQELQGMPEFRKIANFTAYTEGWGLYAELLPKEIGLYQDPYADFGRLSAELWRAARLVVDTGIHAKRWTRAEAIAYMDENTPNAHADNVREVERYIVMPGQATAYKIGMMKILELREHARQVLGPKFDIAGFHDVVLKDGAVPLHVLETLVSEWIAKVEKTATGAP